MTDFKEDINVFGDITSQSTIIVDDGTASDELIIGFFPGDIDSYGIGPSSAVGLFKLVPNSSAPIIRLGEESSATTGFLDVENNGILNLNILENGQVRIGTGGLDISSGGDITLGAGNTVDGVDINNPNGSITVVSNRYQLANDVVSPGNNFLYSTNGIGNKGWNSATDIASTLSWGDLSNVDETTTPPNFGNIPLWDGTNWVPSQTPTFEFTVNDGTCVANFVDTTGLDFCNTQIGATAGSAFYIGQRALGTPATPTAITDGTKLAGYAASGFDDTAFYVCSEISFFATEDFNATDGGTEMRFGTTPNGAKAQVNRLIIENDGTLNVSGTTDYENQVLDDDDVPNRKWITDNYVFGTEYQFATNNTEASTGSTTFQNYLTLTTPVIPAGTYRIGWFAVTRKSAASNDYSARVQIDNSIDLIDPANGGQIQVEHKDPGTNQRVPYSGFGEVTFATAGSHTIDYDYREQSGGTSFTYQVNLEIWRVS